jgi:peptidoglycan/LPS O-acetylase OafA/YrhL
LIRLVLHLPPPEYRGLAPAIVSVAAAALLVIFVERPVERWRQSRMMSAKAGLPAVAEKAPAAGELSARPLGGGW